MLSPFELRSKKKKKSNPLPIYIYISAMSEVRSARGKGLFFIWALQLTALFLKAIWLCVHKRGVRVGQEALGIKPPATLVRECVSVHVLCVKPHPLWLTKPRA